jgi:hypothetical protein
VAERSFKTLRDWTEPAHPGMIRFHTELISVYREMRKAQAKIDQAFDEITSKIGYIVTTTIPVRIDITAEGKVVNQRLDSEALKGTEFERMAKFLGSVTNKEFVGVPAGSYRFYLIWYDALRLKLRRDWVEPAHVLRGFLDRILGPVIQKETPIRYEPQEPAHWFNPGIMIEIEDVIVISAIDEVYPELRLAERLAADRLAIAKIGPGVREPAHFHGSMLQERGLLAELRALMDRQR